MKKIFLFLSFLFVISACTKNALNTPPPGILPGTVSYLFDNDSVLLQNNNSASSPNLHFTFRHTIPKESLPGSYDFIAGSDSINTLNFLFVVDSMHIDTLYNTTYATIEHNGITYDYNSNININFYLNRFSDSTIDGSFSCTIRTLNNPGTSDTTTTLNTISNGQFNEVPVVYFH